MPSLFPNSKNTDIFQVPKAAQEVVPEKKVPKAPPKEPEAPPVTGTCWPRHHSAEEMSLQFLRVILVHCSLT